MPETERDYDALRDQGRLDAETTAIRRAPADRIERIAWAAGWGREDQLRSAVRSAREAGSTWGLIAEALGEPEASVVTQYGSGGLTGDEGSSGARQP